MWRSILSRRRGYHVSKNGPVMQWRVRRSDNLIQIAALVCKRCNQLSGSQVVAGAQEPPTSDVARCAHTHIQHSRGGGLPELSKCPVSRGAATERGYGRRPLVGAPCAPPPRMQPCSQMRNKPKTLSIYVGRRTRCSYRDAPKVMHAFNQIGA